VTIAPGTAAGAERVLDGLGEPGRFGGEAGNLRITINVRPHRWLERRSDEIWMELPVSLSEAALGARVDVPTLDGWVTLDLPAGAHTGAKLRLRGRGVPTVASDGAVARRGDQFIRVVVETPQLPVRSAGASVGRTATHDDVVAGSARTAHEVGGRVAGPRGADAGAARRRRSDRVDADADTAQDSPEVGRGAAPTRAPPEVRSEVPSEAPSEAPPEVPSEVPPEAPSEVPPEAPAYGAEAGPQVAARIGADAQVPPAADVLVLLRRLEACFEAAPELLPRRAALREAARQAHGAAGEVAASPSDD
jgi:hypothetical protein